MVDMTLDHPVTATDFDRMSPTQVQKALDRLSHTILGTIRWKKTIKDLMSTEVQIPDGSGHQVSWEEPAVLGSYLEIRAIHEVYNPQSTIEKPRLNLLAAVGEPVVCWVGSQDPVYQQLCYRIGGLPMDEEIHLSLHFAEGWESLLMGVKPQEKIPGLRFKPEMVRVVLNDQHRGAFFDFEIIAG